LCLPEALRDTRAFVNFFVAVNMIHPHVRGQVHDEWAREREELRAQALRDWRRRAVYPEESWYFEPGENGPVIRHSLRYLPGGYVPERPLPKAVSPAKEGA